MRGLPLVTVWMSNNRNHSNRLLHGFVSPTLLLVLLADRTRLISYICLKMHFILGDLFTATSEIFNFGIFQTLQLHLHFLWIYKLTPLTAQSWPTSLTSAPYARGWLTASTGTSDDEHWTSCRAIMKASSPHLFHLFSDDCPRWCGKFVILNTTPKHSTSQGHSLSPLPSLSLTSCCSSLSKYAVSSQKCAVLDALALISQILYLDFPCMLFDSGVLLLSQGPKSHRSHASVQNYEEGYILWLRRWGVFTNVHAYADICLKWLQIFHYFLFFFLFVLLKRMMKKRMMMMKTLIHLEHPQETTG